MHPTPRPCPPLHSGVVGRRKPFFLYPAAMQSTVPSRWGERVSKLYSPATWQHILQLGSAASYTFNADAPLTDTMDSHRLALLAEQQGHQKAVVHEVSRRYFEEGVPLADRASLLEVAEMCGVTGAREFLESDAGTAEVMQSVKAHQDAGIHSIPVGSHAFVAFYKSYRAPCRLERLLARRSH